MTKGKKEAEKTSVPELKHTKFTLAVNLKTHPQQEWGCPPSLAFNVHLTPFLCPSTKNINRKGLLSYEYNKMKRLLYKIHAYTFRKHTHYFIMSQSDVFLTVPQRFLKFKRGIIVPWINSLLTDNEGETTLFSSNQEKNIILMMSNCTLLVPQEPGLSCHLHGMHACLAEGLMQPTWPASLCTHLSAEPPLWTGTPRC